MLSRRLTPGVSYQLYSSRKFAPVTDTIAMLGRLGYDQAEGFDGVYDQAEDVRRALDASGMSMPTGHFPLRMLETALDRVMDLAGTLGMAVIVCPSPGTSHFPGGAAGWQQLGRRLDSIGARLGECGLRLGWHNHDYEFRLLPDGSLPLDHLFAGAPGLAWQFDVAWAVIGGQDPLPLIARHAGRILSAHVKDTAPAGTNVDQDGWTDVGQGTLDWPSLCAALRAVGCGHLVIEHDNPLDDRSFASSSIAAVRGY